MLLFLLIEFINIKDLIKNLLKNLLFAEKNRLYFFLVKERGINTSRHSVFGDRIDHTLFDLKQYFEGKRCKLMSSYELPRTRLWLESFNDFGEMVEYMKIDGIFTNENNEVYDLGKSNSEIICSHYDTYNRHWEEDYYENVKEKIKIFRDMFSC